MRHHLLTAVGAVLAAGLLSGPGLAAPAASAPVQAEASAGFRVAPDYYTLPNGLKVVLLRDTAVPTATVGVYYGIGFRIEPRDRTGFAHLFEHLLFQGSENAGKGEFIDLVTNSGGAMNGSTRFDFTNYYEVVPSGALEAILWGEADRMARPVINQAVLENQQGVVANEVKVNVINQPYGGWPWLDLPQVANTNWYNAHNFYGELTDLENATVEDATSFHRNFYSPNNAVLVVAGDFEPGPTRAWIERYFGPIARSAPVVLPDISEPRRTEENRASRVDPLAPRPAWTVGYHVPERGTPEWFAMGLIDQLLVQGRDSRLFQEIVQERGLASGVQGGINIGLGNMYNYNGPMLWTVGLIHDADKAPADVEAAVDAVIDEFRTTPVSAADLERARTKIRSNLYGIVDEPTRFGLVDLLAVHALFDDDPTRVNDLEAGFATVTPELIQATAQAYLRPTNRTILVVEAGAARPAAAPAAAQAGAAR
jgi:predicted Zn-dependent peptidase